MKNKFDENFDEFLISCGENEPDYEDSFGAGWESCKEEIIKELKSYPIYLLDDLIDKIEKEF
ncbi:MAG: hypothetical protein AABY22_18695 [Nanoarchaeota archaeon]